MSTEIEFCPYAKCRRRLFRIDIEGDVMTITPLHAGEVRWSLESIFYEEWDTLVASCRRHGHVTDLGVDVLKHNYRCATVLLQKTPAAHERRQLGTT